MTIVSFEVRVTNKAPWRQVDRLEVTTDSYQRMLAAAAETGDRQLIRNVKEAA